jgi:hypothetical protein
MPLLFVRDDDAADYSETKPPLTKARRRPLTVCIDGLSIESEQGMRCGIKVLNPQLPPQL